jgi:hypothetical protein
MLKESSILLFFIFKSESNTPDVLIKGIHVNDAIFLGGTDDLWMVITLTRESNRQ